MKTSKTLVVLALTAAVVMQLGCACPDPNRGGTPPPVAGGTDVPPRTEFTPPANPNPTPTDPERELPMDDVGRELQDKLVDVFFAFDKYNLTPESRATLTEDARVLRDPKYKHLFVVIEGHCDERGTNEYNLALGDRRARAARDFLLQSDVSGGMLGTISYGEEKPFQNGHDEFAWAQNRRAHFTVKDR